MYLISQARFITFYLVPNKQVVKIFNKGKLIASYLTKRLHKGQMSDTDGKKTIRIFRICSDIFYTLYSEIDTFKCDKQTTTKIM